MSIILVGQRECAFSNSKTLGTIGVLTCICIVAHNEITKKTLLMHVDTMTDFLHVVKLLEHVNASRIHLIGTTKFGYQRLIAHLETKYQVKIDMRHELSVSVKVNPQTGEIIVGDINMKDLKQNSQSEIDQLVLRMESFDVDAYKSKLHLIMGYDGDYVENPRTLEDVLLFEHFHKPEPVLTGYCAECQKTINYGGMHNFVCSTAKKCVECGQRTDLGLYTAHDNTCSQYVKN
jgi:hypothetical protein